ncbi:MAG: DedA family protein [Magnetospirillum sp.]|nr:DedA family protein [Magnetospirillum sp.]
MEDFVLNIVATYHYLTYPVILAATFIEGETIVILCGAAARDLAINVELLALFAFAGSFLGDQLYYYIGRKYGSPLLIRWPTLGRKIDWAFRLVKDHPTLFILSFRFIYGIRNIAPFVIGISEVPRLRYFILNFIAAQIWAHSFAWGGYLLGRALEKWLGSNRWLVMLGFIAVAAMVAAFGYARQKKKLRDLEAREAAAGATERACLGEASTE